MSSHAKVQLFKRTKLINGYALAVRDPWNYHIKRVHVSEEELNMYLKRFGELILTEDDFLKWWCEIHSIRKC